MRALPVLYPYLQGIMHTVQNTVALTVTIFNLQGSVTSLSDITCNGGSDGAVTVTASPGTGMAPFLYSLDGGVFVAVAPSQDVIGESLCQDKDALLCTFDVPFVIDQPAPVTGTASSLKNVSVVLGVPTVLLQ
jgi:hypothetical protein